MSRLQLRKSCGNWSPRIDRRTDTPKLRNWTSTHPYWLSRACDMADPDPREITRALIEEVRRTMETALADPAWTQERKDLFQFALRVAEWSTALLDARLHNRRYDPDPDGKLVDMEGPPTAEELQEALWDLHRHALAFFELGSLSISPEAQAHIHRMLTTPARVEKAAKAEKRKGERREIAAAIRQIADERNTPAQRPTHRWQGLRRELPARFGQQEASRPATPVGEGAGHPSRHQGDEERSPLTGRAATGFS
jgi:hypothetical protein